MLKTNPSNLKEKIFLHIIKEKEKETKRRGKVCQ